MIHWDWVLTLVTVVFIIDTINLFLRVTMNMMDVVYPYMKSFMKTVVATRFPQATVLIDELLPDDQEWNNYDPTTQHKGTVVPPTTPQA